jgi:hypothetical protein
MDKFNNITISIIVFLSVSCCINAHAVIPGDYLILQSVGSYSSSGKGKCGDGAGFLEATDHFGQDHADATCRTGYYFMAQDLAVSIQVTQHAGVDSDRWLLHEVDRDFRNYYGIPGKSFGPRQISGQTIIENLVAGASYRWLSGSKIIVIEYRDSTMTKPEPLEVIQAYLQKHPSTMSAFTLEELRSNSNKTTWIKDEMERRLWLCDKWFMQLQLGKAQESQVLQESVKSMNIFLDYREKYYGMAAAAEKNLLAGYLSTNNGTAIKAKLDEYKKWWAVNKEKGISLP